MYITRKSRTFTLRTVVVYNKILHSLRCNFQILDQRVIEVKQ